MTFVRAIFRFIFKAGSTVCLLLLLAMVFMAIVAAKQPIRISHRYQAGGSPDIGNRAGDLALLSFEAVFAARPAAAGRAVSELRL